EKRYRFSSDTSIGIIFTSGMALGVLLMSLKSGYQPELISFLFGNILAITNLEMWLIVCLSLIIFVFIFVNLRRIVLLSFDRDSAYISGIRVDMLQLSTNIFLAVSVVLGIKVLGIVLVSALLLIPVATAKIFSNSFKKLLIFSLIISELTVILGLIVSYFLDLPTGPVIVLAGTLIFIFVAIIRRKKL
ncbi:metal ABC transporter permease, partial [Patescibacteria group bacterium]|nr:metal ABC transporter permease [Patescibacteria group bacterium]